jgi:hypothetical protein
MFKVFRETGMEEERVGPPETVPIVRDTRENERKASICHL